MAPMTSPARDDELDDLVAEAHAALKAPTVERVSRCLAVLPPMVAALDRVCLYKTELRDVRQQATTTVRAFREAVWAIQREHKDVTFNAASVQTQLNKMDALLATIDRLLYTESPP